MSRDAQAEWVRVAEDAECEADDRSPRVDLARCELCVREVRTVRGDYAGSVQLYRTPGGRWLIRSERLEDFTRRVEVHAWWAADYEVEAMFLRHPEVAPPAEVRRALLRYDATEAALPDEAAAPPMPRPAPSRDAPASAPAPEVAPPAEVRRALPRYDATEAALPDEAAAPPMPRPAPSQDAPASAPAPEVPPPAEVRRDATEAPSLLRQLGGEIRRRWPRRNLQARLLECLAGRDAATYEEIAEHVYDDEETSDEAIEQLVLRANDTLTELDPLIAPRPGVYLRYGASTVYADCIGTEPRRSRDVAET